MHLALSHPEVAFQFLNNGQEKLRTSGNGKLKDVIYNVYGRDVAANLIEIDYEKNGIHITGFLGKPIITRGNRNFEKFLRKRPLCQKCNDLQIRGRRLS